MHLCENSAENFVPLTFKDFPLLFTEQTDFYSKRNSIPTNLINLTYGCHVNKNMIFKVFCYSFFIPKSMAAAWKH